MVSVRLAPVGAVADIDLERYLHLHGPRHLFFDQLFHADQFSFRDLENQFVVDLHDQAAYAALSLNPRVHADHGALDDVGCRTLNRVIDGVTPGKGQHVTVAAVDIRDRQTPAEDGGDKPILLGLTDTAVEEGDGAAVALFIGGDEILGGLAGGTQLFCQAEGALAVDDAEVDGLGLAAHLRGDHFGKQAENFGGGTGMDVFIMGEGVAENRITGQVRQDAQHDLGIVGRQDDVPRRRDEGVADQAPFV